MTAVLFSHRQTWAARSQTLLLMLLVVLLAFHETTTAAAAAAAGAGAAPGAQEQNIQKELSEVRNLQSILKDAELKLLGNDSNALDVGGAVTLLSKVHHAVTQHLNTAAASAAAAAKVRAGDADKLQQQQQHEPQQDSQLLSGSFSSDDSDDLDAQDAALSNRPTLRRTKRQARRMARIRRAKVAAAWQQLGRASFTLAALSASGLITEYLPAQQQHPADVTAATAALCQQLQAARSIVPDGAMGERRRPTGGRGGSSSSTSSSSSSAVEGDAEGSCNVATSDPKVLQELEWLLTAASSGTVEAQMALADRFLMGRGGLAASCADGMGWLQKAATSVMHTSEASGNWDLVPSFIRLRERFIDMTSPQSYSEWDDGQMAEELQAAAAYGSSDSYAQRRLGYRLLLGKGMSVDYKAAYKNFVAAADGGNDGYALYNLGIMYLRGWYVERDPLQALQYFKRALERGVGAAANAIGVLAYNGEAMPADNVAAARWFEKGANMSDPDSIYNLGSLYLYGKGVTKDAQAALSYYGMAFDLGHWKASYALGQLYAGDEPELGHNCEYAEKYFWQFVSQRSPWLTEAQTALRDYDSVSSTSTTTTSTSAAASLQGSGEGAEAQPGSAAARVVVPFRITDRYLQALVRYLLLAESGCEAAAENAAWMLLHGQGASGPRAMGLAAHLLYRSSILNHTSSMVELARLLLNDSIITHPQQLQEAVKASGSAFTGTNITLGLLHHVLLQQPNAFMPPVAGPTACTGVYRKELPAIVQNVSNATAVVPTGRSAYGSVGHQQQQRKQQKGSQGVGSAGGEAAGLALGRARRAAVAWLSEANSVGDAEASAMLGWLWHEGLLQGSRAQQEALAVITRAMAAHPPPGQQAALQLVQSLIWIEQQAQQWLGGRAVAAVRSWLVALRDEAVRVHGMHPLVLDMPDGFVCASTRTPPDGRSYPQISQRAHQHTGVRAVLGGALAVATQALTACFTWLSSLTDGGGSSSGGSRSGDARAAGQKGSGWWEAVGADKVDKENLVLTCLLGALAGVLWLHVRQQGQAARRGLQQQMEAQMGDPRPGPEGVVGEGGVAAGGDALQLPAAVPQTQGRPSPLMRRNVQPPQPQQG